MRHVVAFSSIARWKGEVPEKSGHVMSEPDKKGVYERCAQQSMCLLRSFHTHMLTHTDTNYMNSQPHTRCKHTWKHTNTHTHTCMHRHKVATHTCPHKCIHRPTHTSNNQLSENIFSVVVGGPVGSCPAISKISSIQVYPRLNQHLTHLQVETVRVGPCTCSRKE